ncbi:MAG: hypothetical protein U1F23_11915 [Lysobacterales bacterium]
MKLRDSTSTAAVFALVLAICGIGTASAASASLECKLSFSLKGWSAIYKRADGHGTVKCDDGTSMKVRIEARGGGLTVGKSRIDNGTGTFSNVHHIGDVLGDYAAGEAHAGVVKSSTARVMTKGEVSLALAGTGEGVDLGVAFGRFTISRAKK